MSIANKSDYCKKLLGAKVGGAGGTFSLMLFVCLFAGVVVFTDKCL